jgi:Chlorophyll A-B binding protein
MLRVGILSGAVYLIDLIACTCCCTCTEAQAFDGPAPETINGRLAMLGVLSATLAELRVPSDGIAQQVVQAPFPILATFIIISLASYVPILRYTLHLSSRIVRIVLSRSWGALVDCCCGGDSCLSALCI